MSSSPNRSAKIRYLPSAQPIRQVVSASGGPGAGAIGCVSSRRIKAAFIEFPGWKQSENALRELRKQVTFAIYAELDDLDRVTTLVDELFTLLEKADRI
jgi:hypothetical protein